MILFALPAWVYLLLFVACVWLGALTRRHSIRSTAVTIALILTAAAALGYAVGYFLT